MNPRNKLKRVDYYLNEIYGDDVGVEIERIWRLLRELFLEYQDSLDNENCVSFTFSSHGGLLDKRNTINDSNENGDEEVDKWMKIKRTKKTKANVRCELEHYLEDDALTDNSCFGNAQVCATILEDSDVKDDGYSSSEIVDINSDHYSEIEALMEGLMPPKLLSQQEKWIPPESNTIKLNFDTSFNSS
ncbi:hypothetical protein V6N13_089385 [Hibiscus sabdariffa]